MSSTSIAYKSQGTFYDQTGKKRTDGSKGRSGGKKPTYQNSDAHLIGRGKSLLEGIQLDKVKVQITEENEIDSQISQKLSSSTTSLSIELDENDNPIKSHHASSKKKKENSSLQIPNLAIASGQSSKRKPGSSLMIGSKPTSQRNNDNTVESKGKLYH